MHDNDLRELFDKWAQPMRDAPPPAMSVIIKRKRRRTARIAGSSVASVAAIAVVASLVGASLSAGRKPAHHVSATPATAPPYYLAVSQSGRSVGVWDSVTGQRVGSVPAPVETSVGGRRYHTVFTALAAGSGRTFVLDATINNNTTTEMPSGLFELHLAADGLPGRLQPLTTVRLHQGRIGRWITAIASVALTADGSDLAIATGTYAVYKEIFRPSKIEVISLVTGSTRTWTASGLNDLTSLSWAGDSTLAFSCSDPSSAVCVLNTSGHGGRIDTAHPLIPSSLTYHGLNTPISPMITPNGSDIYAALQGHGIGLVEFSARTGRPLRLVIPAQPDTNGYCGTLWSDPSGQQLTASCTWGSLTGTISRGVFKRGRNLPPAPTAIRQSGSTGSSLIAW